MIKFNHKATEPFRGLADSLKADAKVEGPKITETTPNSTFNKHLPEGITPDQVKTLDDYRIQYIQGSRLAVAELAADAFQASTDLKVVEASFGFGTSGASVKLTAEREHVYPNPQAAEGQPTTTTKQMVIGVTIKQRGQSGKGLRDAISEEYAGMFKR